MRMLTLSTLLILPAALVAQAPVNVSQQLKSEQPIIEGMVKEFRAKDALFHALSLTRIEKTPYDTKDLNTVRYSQNVWRDLMRAHLLAGRTAFAAGEWEKSGEILQSALVLAQENKAAFIAGAQPTLDTWKAPEAEAKAFLAEKPARMEELKADIAKVQAELADQEAIKKLNKAEKAALQERQTKAQAASEELAQLESAKPVMENNLKLAGIIHAAVEDTLKICDEDIKAVNAAIERGQNKVKGQADEIQAFNTKLRANKKIQIKGNSNWVNAVMNDHENVTKLGAPEVQASFLNRMLVLDPGNVLAKKSLDNIVAGKAPFEAEKKSTKGKAKKSR